VISARTQSLQRMNGLRTHVGIITCSCFLILAAAGSWPYLFYIFVRFLVCGVAVHYCLTRLRNRSHLWIWLFGSIAILFNPVLPIHMSRQDWQAANALTASFFLIWLLVSTVLDGKAQSLRSEGDIETKSTQEPEAAGTANTESLDLGLHLADQATDRNVIYLFQDIKLEELTIAAPGYFFIETTYLLNGTPYQAKFAFGFKILNEILVRSPRDTQKSVRRTLDVAPTDVWRVPFPYPINLELRTILGVPRREADSYYVPLQVIEVSVLDTLGGVAELQKEDTENLSASKVDIRTNDAQDVPAARETPDSLDAKRDEQIPDPKETVSTSYRYQPEISMQDVEAIREYTRHLAREWWKDNQQVSASCKLCQKTIYRSDVGFRNYSDLLCDLCFTSETISENLNRDRNHYGWFLVFEARRFVNK
jgi:hypothetical protein